LQPDQKRGDTGRHAAGHCHENPAQADSVDEPRGNRDVSDLDPRVPPRRARGHGDDGHQCRDENEAVQEKLEWRRIRQPVFRRNEACAPEQDKDYRKHELQALVASVDGKEIQPHEVPAEAAYHGLTRAGRRGDRVAGTKAITVARRGDWGARTPN
jgi:hypothetical protein